MTVLRFELFGFPIRVQPWFFLTVFFIGPRETPLRIVTWIAVAFVGVLMHELGHALAGRRFGLEPAIELHAFGGVTAWARGARLSPQRQLLISAAGPAVGIAVGVLTLVVSRSAPPPAGTPLYDLVWDLLWVNLGWAVLNLLPILPLDGGNIMTSIAEMVWPQRGRRVARILSLGATVVIALWALSAGQLWIAIIGGVLAFGNLQALRAEHPRRRQHAVTAELEQAAYDARDYARAAELGAALFARHRHPTTAFNVACSLARAGHAEEALLWLERAVDAGLDDLAQLDSDPDLEPVRALAGYQRLRSRIGG